MRLTDHSDYSLRVLMYLNQQKTMVTLNELSEKLDISKNNLIKVSNQLARLNFIETTKGRSGGLSIHEGTGRRSLKDILMHTEKTFYMAECFSKNACKCSFLPTCSLKRTLSDALHAFLSTLAQKTLDDVTPRKRGIGK